MTRTFGIDTSRMGEEELLAALGEIEQRRRVDYAREVAVLAELDGRTTAGRRGYRDVAVLAREILRINAYDARQRVTHARTAVARHGPTGTPLKPDLPEVGAAVAEGAIGPEHEEAIRATMARFPQPVSLPDREHAEALLTTAAREYEPHTVTALGREIVARLNQDGNPPTEHDLTRPARFLDWRDTRGGRLRGTFELDPETAALLTGLIEPRAKPHSSPEEPDRRSKHQRQGDAPADMLRAAARCPDDGPTEPGEPVTVMVSITPDDLKHGTGHGLLHGQESHSATQIRRIACDTYVAPALLGSTGEILNIGQKHRTIPLTIRRALILRDNGCTFPGHRRKPKQCQAHHVTLWANGGPTALHNLTLLYPHHHHNLIHHTEWHIRIRNGLPEFIPPTFLHPKQRPRRNLLHHEGTTT
ncbi:HNH endonuclease signature motif containing protein [Amycolatopsis cihanbeyliensis]|uniref:HNH endonuclease signature motif containing protein n=1 Tax=Amycolatopsis cihanbeyliensis TaxID=1128664 RepID=UPI0014768323|nr:HNH endonuclease signature motif containing protein [Amycolatopsis cihanbeyliensis]